METLILNGDEVRSLITPEMAVDAVERAFAAHGRGETVMPSKIYVPVAHHDGDFRGMPVYMDGFAGIKWVNAHPHNPQRHGLPAVLAIFILNDPATAVPLAILDATGMTAVRTGAGAAIATKHLARTNIRTLGIIGCGVQARSVVACHRCVIQIDDLVLHDRNPAAAERLAAELHGLPCRVGDMEDAAACDVLCTLTPARAPLVPRAAVRNGTHINAMGADAPGKQELDPAVLCDARIFLDDRGQACESGEVNVALSQGLLRREEIAGTLGEVVAGSLPGRGSNDEITIFDSTGLAVQDLAIAHLVYEQARSEGVGLLVELVRP